MEEFNTGTTVLLLDDFGIESEKLWTSFQLSYRTEPVSVIEEDGFLPDGVESVYGFFLGNFQGKENVPGRPLFFNEVKVPDFWEIKGNNSSGEIYDRNHLRGRIFYAKEKEKRQIRVVDWLDDRGIVRFCDHYNKYGVIYARTAFNAKGQKVNKAFFDAEGKEIIVENYVTRDILLNEGNKTLVFPGKTEFVIYYLKKKGFEKSQLFYNSLSTPFFVSQSLGKREKKDVLFWQEDERDDVPGNMQVILSGQSHTGKIIVQKRKAYEKFRELQVPAEWMEYKGYLYPFQKANTHGTDILICTNSDQIANLDLLVRELPDMQFHIAAITEMSSKLMAFGSRPNVFLYPNVPMKKVKELFTKCDYYLDINYGSEILDSVYQAFLHNQLVLGFKETLHNREYIHPLHRFDVADGGQMVELLRNAKKDEGELDLLLEKQRAYLS